MSIQTLSIQTGSTRGRVNSSRNAAGSHRPRNPAKIRGGSTGSKLVSNDRLTRDENTIKRGDFSNWNQSNPVTTQPSDSNRRDAPESQSADMNNRSGFSRNATAMATAFEPLNRYLEIFITRFSRTNERSEKSKRVFKIPRCSKDESDGCVDAWNEVMKMHFGETT